MLLSISFARKSYLQNNKYPLFTNSVELQRSSTALKESINRIADEKQ